MAYIQTHSLVSRSNTESILLGAYGTGVEATNTLNQFNF